MKGDRSGCESQRAADFFHGLPESEQPNNVGLARRECLGIRRKCVYEIHRK